MKTVRLELLQLRFLLKAKADVCADKSVPLKQSLAIIEELSTLDQLNEPFLILFSFRDGAVPQVP